MGQYNAKKPNKINPVSISVTVVILGLGYLGWFYFPHWFQVFRISGVMRGVGTEAYRNFDDQKLMKKLVDESKRLIPNLNENNFKIQRVKYTNDELNALEVKHGTQRDVYQTRGKELVIEFAYIFTAKWPLTQKTTKLEFHKEVVQDLSVIAY